MLWSPLLARLGPSATAMVRGADDTVARRSGRKLAAKGGYREAVRSPKQPVSHCCGRKGVAMLRLVPVPWRRRVWALSCLTARGWPAEPHGRRRHTPRRAGVRQLRKHGRRGVSDRPLVVVVDGGVAAVALALAWGQPRVAMVARLRGEAARYHPPGPPSAGKRGRNPLQGTRPRNWPGWAARSETPGETREVDWDGGPRQPRWASSRPALWDTPRVPPGALRSVLVGDPAGKRRREVFCCTARDAPPAQLRPWVVLRWSVAVTFAETRAHLGLETQRPWSAHASARTTPVRLALFSRVTGLAWPLRHGGHMPGPVTAGYRQAEPTVADGLAVGRGPRWRARSVVNSPPEAAWRQWPREALERLIHGLP